MLTFTRINQSILYELPGVGTPGQSPGVVAYLFPQDVGPKDEVSLREAWGIRHGLFLFLEKLPSDGKLDDFTSAVWEQVDQVDHASFAWIPGDPDQTDDLTVQYLPLQPSSKQNGTIERDTSLTFQQFRLFYADSVPVTVQDLESDAPSFLFENNQDQGIRLAPSPDTGGRELTKTTLKLTGDELGYQLFTTRFDAGDIGADNFDLACRFSIRSNEGNSVAAESLRYPVFDLEGDAALHLAVRLNPTFVADSCFAIRSEATGSLASFFRTVDGRKLSLTPREGARLYLSLKPVSESSQPYSYLVPDGEFTVALETSSKSGNRAAATTADDAGPPELLCGLAGTETISFVPGTGGEPEAGHVIAFYRDLPAYAPGFGSDEPRRGPLLTSKFTTSWVAVGPPHSDTADAATSANQYFAQPDGAAMYSLSTAVCQDEKKFLGFLRVPAANLPASVSKDGAYPLTSLAGARPDLEGFHPDTYRGVEQGALSPTRKERITGVGGMPRRDAVARQAGDQVSGTTPQGLITRLPDPGLPSAGNAVPGWDQVALAKNLDEDLGTVRQLLVEQPEPEFQNALQSSKLFLVITKAGLMGAFAKQITIGAWPFDIDVAASAGTKPPAEGTFDNVLIFKFFDEKIETLVDNLGSWADADHFNGDATRAGEVQKFLQGFFKEARTSAKEQPELFGPFVEQILETPTWNGILALNVKLPLGDLPEEVRGLLGGIKKPDLFKAHHFGVETSKTDESGGEQKKSSLFALLDYEDDGKEEGRIALTSADASPYDFTVKTLQILFANTEIKEFKSRIELTLNELFDEKSTLESADGTAAEQGNTIELEGSYERHETDDDSSQSQATYTFIYEGNKVFRIAGAVLKSATLKKVQFTTVSTSEDAGTATIKSEFAFWGELAFGSLGDFDFFSFDSLGFADLKLGMHFSVKDGRLVEGSRGFDFDPGNLRFNVAFSQTRQDSLLGNFPLRLSGFVFNTREGQSVNDLGFLNVPGLIPLPAGLPTTDAPLYALTLSLSLGSMGSLVSDSKGFAIEILAGWTPSGEGETNKLAFGIKLPESGGGGKEIGIEGVLTLSVEDFGFLKLPENPGEGEDYLYVLYLNKAVLKILGTQIPPGFNFSTLLFVPFQNGTSPDLSNLGWFVAFEPTGQKALTAPGGRAGTERSGLVLDDATGRPPPTRLQAAGEGSDSPVLKLDYLGLGQRIAIETDKADTVVDVIDAMKKLIPANKTGEDLRKQLAKLYRQDAGWLIGTDFTLFGVMRLAIVFAEGPNVYGLLIGFQSPEALKGFQFQVLYKKITDNVGVFKIVLQLPDSVRSQQFGAVGFTIPTAKFDIFTNGDFRVDIGFPDGLDFSNSFSVQAQAGPVPVIGFGGFFFAKLSSATADTVPEIPPEVGTFEPVLEAGIGLSLGVGKTIDKGIFRAGLTVTFVGILEGTVAWFVTPEQMRQLSAARRELGNGALVTLAAAGPTFNRAPDFYRAKGVLAVVGKLYGEVDFGIVKAGVSLTIWASVTITFEAYALLDLEIAAGVSVKVTVVIGSFKIFGKKIEIKVSFSFSTRISYTFSIADNRTPPWGRLIGVGAGALTAPKDLEPILWEPHQVVETKGTFNLYFAPQVTVAMDGDEQLAQAVATLVIDNADGKRWFDGLLSVLLRWILELADAPESIDQAFLEEVLWRLDLPVTLARTPGKPLNYAALSEFLSLNFNPVLVEAQPPEDVAGVSTNDAGVAETEAMSFPIISDLGADFDGVKVPFWSTAPRSIQYQEDLARYFAQLLVNFEAKGGDTAMSLTDAGEVSVATTLFEDYFALLVKGGINQAAEYVEKNGAQSLNDLLAGLAKPGDDGRSGLANVGNQASRFLLHGLQVPENFGPDETSGPLRPLYQLDGQQHPIRLEEGKAWDLSLYANESPIGTLWFAVATGD
ncbi:MAG: hypothetical protein ABFS23_00110, partial [Pseudomonadota bacterium]